MQYNGGILISNLEVEIIAYYKNKKHSDTGNLSKGCLDALEKIIYKNDNQIKRLSVTVYEKSQEEKFEIKIKEIK